MKRNLPPLKALRAFEAAARLMSFSKAAEELHVTHSAISQQIKIIEDFYGRNLFIRQKSGSPKKRIALSQAGSDLYGVAKESFDQLDAISEKLTVKKEDDHAKTITINLTAAFAAHWLIPRMSDFQQAHPDIAIRLIPSSTFPGFDELDCDIAIRWYADLSQSNASVKLFDVDAFAACAPDFLKQHPEIKDRENLASNMLIHDDKGNAWQDWLAKAEVKSLDLSHGYFYPDTSLALQAAVSGQGLIAAGSILALNDLEAGRLIIPYDIFLPRRNSYFLSQSSRCIDKTHVRIFCDWIIDQAKKYEKIKPDIRKYLSF